MGTPLKIRPESRMPGVPIWVNMCIQFFPLDEIPRIVTMSTLDRIQQYRLNHVKSRLIKVLTPNPQISTAVPLQDR